MSDFRELEGKRESRQLQRRSWNDRDEFYGPKHPLKAKYRGLNSEATKLFLKNRYDYSFFDQYATKEM